MSDFALEGLDVELERLVLLEAVDKPRTVKGGVPGVDRVYDVTRQGRQNYRLIWAGPVVRIEDRDSGEVELVPLHQVRQMRPLPKAAGVDAMPLLALPLAGGAKR